MQTFLWNELRTCNRDIRELTDEAELEAGANLIIHTIENMKYLSDVARKEGLLSLEEAAEEMRSFHQGDNLQRMLSLVMDGTDPDLVEEICVVRFLADGLEGFDALQYILMARAVLAIQAGENRIVTETLLLSAIPEYIRKQYCEKAENAE